MTTTIRTDFFFLFANNLINSYELIKHEFIFMKCFYTVKSYINRMTEFSGAYKVRHSETYRVTRNNNS